jgi:hypothetical protein
LIDKFDDMARKYRSCIEILCYGALIYYGVTIHDDAGYLGEERIDGEDHVR